MRVVFFLTWQAGRKRQASGKPVAPGVDVLVWQFATRSPVTVPGVWKIRAVHRASVSVRLFRPWGFRKILVQPWLLVLLDFSFFFSMMTMTVNPHHQYFQLEAMAALPRFQAMTGGVDWNDLSEPLETSISSIMSVAGVPRGWGSGWDAWWIGCHWPRFEPWKLIGQWFACMMPRSLLSISPSRCEQGEPFEWKILNCSACHYLSSVSFQVMWGFAI